MRAADVVVEMGRLDNNIERAREAFDAIKNVKNSKSAQQRFDEVLSALKAALRCAEKLAPKNLRMGVPAPLSGGPQFEPPEEG